MRRARCAAHLPRRLHACTRPQSRAADAWRACSKTIAGDGNLMCARASHCVSHRALERIPPLRRGVHAARTHVCMRHAHVAARRHGQRCVLSL
jgi:hypothetical protein